MQSPPPLNKTARLRQQLGLDDEQQFITVVEDGTRRWNEGMLPVLTYKDQVNPLLAYELARTEWMVRQFISARSDAHLMPDIKRVGDSHYSAYLAPWMEALDAIKELRDFAQFVFETDGTNITIEANMNGIVVRLRCPSHPERIHRDWLRALDGCTKGPIGPRAHLVLSDAILRRDARIIARKTAERQAQKAAEAAELQAWQEELDAALQDLPEMEIGDPHQEQLWQEAAASEPEQYVISFGKTWARLMQAEMKRGEPLEAIITDTFRLAHGSVPGLFGSEVGAVLNYVALTWAHRDLFRQHTHLVSPIHTVV